MPDDKAFEATECVHSPGPVVSDNVRRGGTHPEHDHAGERDHSPHDGDRGGTLDGEHVNDPVKGIAGLDH